MKKLKNPLTLSGGTGVTLSNSGVGFDGTSPLDQSMTVGNDISQSGNVQFNSVTASAYDLGSFTLKADRWESNFSAGGSIDITGNLTIPGNATINGKVIAERFETEVTGSTIIFNSGSSQFGDTVDDTHYMTGSVYQTGSFVLNRYSVNEFSNDITLADNSSTALMTESGSKGYTDVELGSSGVPTTTDLYLRKNYNKTVSSVTNNTASFNASFSASSAGGLTATSEEDFIFFNNGQVMEHDALSIEQSGSTFYLKVDPNSIGYNLSSDDEIKVWGKFEPKGELHFDGQYDEVNTNFSGSSGQGTHIPVPKTYSFWAKSSETGRNYAIFGWGTNKKSFLFNFDSGRPLRWYAGHWYVYWDDTSAQDDGQWHHWMVYDSPDDLSLSKVYVDGTLLPINQIHSGSETGAANYLKNLTIGSYRPDGNAVDAHFSGSIKEFSVFGGDKTSYASIYYNNGEPYDVTDETGLQAYWKMTENVGTTVFDYSGNVNSNGNRYHGTIPTDGGSGGASWETAE